MEAIGEAEQGAIVEIFGFIDYTQARARRKVLRGSAKYGKFDADHRIYRDMDPAIFYFRLDETQMKRKLLLTIDGQCPVSADGTWPIFVETGGHTVAARGTVQGPVGSRHELTVEIPIALLGPPGWENDVRVTTNFGGEFWIYRLVLGFATGVT